MVEYQIGFRGAAEKGTLTVWIDAASHLPLKRVFTINDASRKVRVTETYSDFVVNAELDSKHFTLPRD